MKKHTKYLSSVAAVASCVLAAAVPANAEKESIAAMPENSVASDENAVGTGEPADAEQLDLVEWLNDYDAQVQTHALRINNILTEMARMKKATKAELQALRDTQETARNERAALKTALDANDAHDAQSRERTDAEFQALRDMQEAARNERVALKTALDANDAHDAQSRERTDAEFQALRGAQEADRNDAQKAISDASARGNEALGRSAISAAVIFAIFAVAAAAVAFVLLRKTKDLEKKAQANDDAIGALRREQSDFLQTQDGALQARSKSQETVAAIDEKLVALDGKLADFLEKTLEAVSEAASAKAAPNHALALKVADEIARMETNLSRVDASVKGFRQLQGSIRRIKDNFRANGYEIVEMIGKPYNEGMRVTADFVTDETLAAGTQIITGVTKPQVNFDGKMIQAAKITVGQNL